MDGTGFQPNAYQSNAFQIPGFFSGAAAVIADVLQVVFRRRRRRG